MKLSESQFNQLSAEFKQYFEPIGGGVGVGINIHPT
jgi:hypothetical protein